MHYNYTHLGNRSISPQRCWATFMVEANVLQTIRIWASKSQLLLAPSLVNSCSVGSLTWSEGSACVRSPKNTKVKLSHKHTQHTKRSYAPRSRSIRCHWRLPGIRRCQGTSEGCLQRQSKVRWKRYRRHWISTSRTRNERNQFPSSLHLICHL